MHRLKEFARRHPDATATVGLLLLPVALFSWALLPGKVMSAADIALAYYPWGSVAPGVVPKNSLLADIVSFHALLIHAAREIRDGHFPLWNPHVFTGAPLFANPQTALLFPLNGLAYLLPIPTALTLISVLKLSVAGIGMYWFLRLISIGYFAALAGAVTFMFNAVLVVWLQWSYANALSALPLLS